MAAKPTSPSVSVRLSLDFVGGRPAEITPEEHVTSILCAVINGVMEQTVRFLDENPDVTGIMDKSELRGHIMDGAIMAATEQLCAAWKYSKQPMDDLPHFVEVMFQLFEQSLAANGGGKGSSTPKPNVGDVGHA